MNGKLLAPKTATGPIGSWAFAQVHFRLAGQPLGPGPQPVAALAGRRVVAGICSGLRQFFAQPHLAQPGLRFRERHQELRLRLQRIGHGLQPAAPLRWRGGADPGEGHRGCARRGGHRDA
ncbi:hypothetical protein OG617_00115 [Micromonospora sp. NBC_01412]